MLATKMSFCVVLIPDSIALSFPRYLYSRPLTHCWLFCMDSLLTKTICCVMFCVWKPRGVCQQYSLFPSSLTSILLPISIKNLRVWDTWHSLCQYLLRLWPTSCIYQDIFFLTFIFTSLPLVILDNSHTQVDNPSSPLSSWPPGPQLLL